MKQLDELGASGNFVTEIYNLKQDKMRHRQSKTLGRQNKTCTYKTR